MPKLALGLLLGLGVMAAWPFAHATATYQVQMDYEGGYHYQFEMKFDDSPGIKTNNELLVYAVRSSFWADPASELGPEGGWEPSIENSTFRWLLFNTENFALQFETDVVFHWRNPDAIPLPPTERTKAHAQTCGISQRELALCPVFYTPAGTESTIQHHARVSQSITVPEPPVQWLVAVAMIWLPWRARRAGPAVRSDPRQGEARRS